MLRCIDHVIILVQDLDAAIAAWEQNGFTVMRGGVHKAGTTHNALVIFADGSYFELIAFLSDGEQAQQHRWWSHVAHGEGLIDYALLSDDVAAVAAEARGRGLLLLGPEVGGRNRQDGQQLEWRSVFQDQGEPVVPFVIEDVTPRELRVPEGDVRHHANGVIGLAGATLVTKNLEPAAEALTSLLGGPGEDLIAEAGEMLRFPVRQQWIALLQPASDTSEPGHYLHGQNSVVYEVTLLTDGSGTLQGNGELLPLDLTNGARLRVVRA